MRVPSWSPAFPGREKLERALFAGFPRLLFFEFLDPSDGLVGDQLVCPTNDGEGDIVRAAPKERFADSFKLRPC